MRSPGRTVRVLVEFMVHELSAFVPRVTEQLMTSAGDWVAPWVFDVWTGSWVRSTKLPVTSCSGDPAAPVLVTGRLTAVPPEAATVTVTTR